MKSLGFFGKCSGIISDGISLLLWNKHDRTRHKKRKHLSTIKNASSVTLPSKVRSGRVRRMLTLCQSLASDDASTPGRDRTCNLRIRSPLLYPLSYGRKLFDSKILSCFSSSHFLGLTPAFTPDIFSVIVAPGCVSQL